VAYVTSSGDKSVNDQVEIKKYKLMFCYRYEWSCSTREKEKD